MIGNPDYGTKGTIELICGSEGDCGRKKAYDEYYSLVAYCRSDSTPTRGEFVTYLKSRINASKNPTYHALYGYDTKYQSKVTDAMFTQLVNIAKQINYHAPSWGCGSAVLTYDSIFTAPGYHYYGNYLCGCYDSNIKADVGWGTGYAGTCDVCGKTYTGNESYTNTGWINCNDGNKQNVRNVNGATHTCGGREVYGPGKVLLGKVYCHYKNENGKVYISYSATPTSGYTASVANTGWFEMSRSNMESVVQYTNGVTTVTFSKNGTAVRSMYLGYYFVLNDNTVQVRKYLAQRAELLGAVRLPNTAFKENAGTEVTSDILFLQKRDRLMDIEPEWVHLATDENGITMNQYFVDHPEMVVGHMAEISGPFGMETACLPDEDRPFEEQLREAIRLNVWLRMQRARKREGKLSDERIEKLESIGFYWDKNKAFWDIGFNHAREYLKVHGNLKLSAHYECEDGFKLQNWLSNQKTKMKNGKLSSEKVEKLKALGI